MVCPVALYVAGLALLAKVSALVCVAVTVTVAGAEVAPLPEAVAVLVIEPASRSDRESVGEGKSVDVGGRGISKETHANVPSLSSVTEKGPARVTLLELVIV